MFTPHDAVFRGSADPTPWIGESEFLLAAAVLVFPSMVLLRGVCALNPATNALFPLSGAPRRKSLERFGRSTAPLALALLPSKNRPSEKTWTLSPAT